MRELAVTEHLIARLLSRKDVTSRFKTLGAAAKRRRSLRGCNTCKKTSQNRHELKSLKHQLVGMPQSEIDSLKRMLAVDTLVIHLPSKNGTRIVRR